MNIQYLLAIGTVASILSPYKGNYVLFRGREKREYAVQEDNEFSEVINAHKYVLNISRKHYLSVM